MQNENESTAFDLSITLKHPELVTWLKEIPEDQITNKVESTLLAGHFMGRLSEELQTLPITKEKLALPVPTESVSVLAHLVNLEHNKDKRAKAFRGLFDLVQQHSNLQIAVDEENNWILQDNVRKIAQTCGSKTRLDIEFHICSDGLITINPALEIAREGKIVVNGANVEAMLIRVAEHLSEI